MSLKTGKKINRQSWDAIPMTDAVIARVNTLGKDQPEQLTFYDRKKRPIGEQEFPGVAEPGQDLDDDVVELPGVDGDNQDPYVEADVNDLDIHPEEELIPDEEENKIEVETVVEDDDLVDETRSCVSENIPEVPNIVPGAPNNIPDAPNELPGVRRSTRATIKTQNYIPAMSGKKYAYAAAQLDKIPVIYPDTYMFHQKELYQAEPDVVAAIMTQLSLKMGMKEWGDRAKEAVHSEMKQLHMRDTFKPMHWKELTHTQKQTVLESHMFLKEKRDGKIKGRTVAGGNKQRDYISKEDASSPTVSTEAVLLTCIIDAEEGRDVAVVDIPNAFVQTRVTDEKDMAIIKIRGILVDILVEIAPKVYGPYVTTDKKDEKQLLVQCLNALYGTMMASLLYYKKFVASLEGIGFELNPYEPCVANKIIEGKQMTICFHVDDCKLSHVNTKVMDKMIEWLKQEYECIFEDGSGEMAVSRGKKHKYLGMTLDYSVKGEVKITMLDYVEEIITAFEKADPKVSGTKSSAAPDDLFKVDEDCKKLGTSKATEFHNLVAKTLYATKRARPDTCASIAFLTTRVREPDEDDWKKLVHLMKYLRGTRTLPLILRADGSGIFKWYIDGSFAVHPNMRGHTGGGLTMGQGFPIVTSTKHKLNTRSSTEAEVVSVDDCMPSICWTRYFMLAQGYGVKESIIYQDNQSAMLLEKNGKASSSKRTKHVAIRFFFITDRIKKGEVSVTWCPTGDMIADFMTKPLQGAMFRRFRDLIMGVERVSPPGTGKEKIEKSEKKSKKK